MVEMAGEALDWLLALVSQSVLLLVTNLCSDLF